MKEEQFFIHFADAKIAIFCYSPNNFTPEKLSQKVINPLLMIHGFRGTHHGLLDIVREIFLIDEKAGIFREIFIPDLPNFGISQPLSQKNDADSFAKLTEEIINIISQKTGSTKIDLFGHSFGTLVVARTAKKSPEKIAKLVLASPISRKPLSHLNAKFANLYFVLAKILPNKQREKWLRAKFAIKIMNHSAVINPAKKPEILAKHLAHFSDFQSVDAMLETYFSAGNDDILSFANEIAVPTLVISGDSDNIAPEKEAIELSRKIPNGKFISIAGVGHILHHETPTEVSIAMVEFLK